MKCDSCYLDAPGEYVKVKHSHRAFYCNGCIAEQSVVRCPNCGVRCFRRAMYTCGGPVAWCEACDDKRYYAGIKGA